MFLRSLCAFLLLASPAVAEDPIWRITEDLTIDGTQAFLGPDEIVIEGGVSVTMIGGDYRFTNGSTGEYSDYGVILASEYRGASLTMIDGALDGVWLSGPDRFQMHGGFVEYAQIGASAFGDAAIYGGTINVVDPVGGALHIHGGIFPNTRFGEGNYPEESWVYFFGDDLTLENGRLTGVFESGDVADYAASGNVAIVRSDYIAGDADFDGDVDLSDLNLVRNNFGLFAAGDVSLNGLVDLADLNLVRNNFGLSIHSVPEPASFMLMAPMFLVALLSTSRRRRPKQ
jgi:hypothetical protein